MPDIETPEAFAVNACIHPTCTGGEKRDVCCGVLADLIRTRDAAVRREALLGVVRWLDLECGKASSSGRASALWEAVEHFRALADKEPSDD